MRQHGHKGRHGFLDTGVIGPWVLGAVLFFANLCLLFALPDKCIAGHGIAVVVCGAFGLGTYSMLRFGPGALSELLLWAAAFGVPGLVISHFIWLVRLVRRRRRISHAEIAAQ
jgi:hypothetical protein